MPADPTARHAHRTAALVSALFLLTSAASLAQIPKSPNAVDKNGQRDGAWTLVFDDDFASVTDAAQGTCYAIVSYISGNPVGRVTLRYLSGEVRWEGELKQAIPFIPVDGQIVTFHKNGKKERTFEIRGGKKEGPETGYFESGKRKFEIPFNAGIVHGKRIEWYEHGQKWHETPYRNGKRDGIGFEWYKNGQKFQEITYKDDLRDGLTSTWYPSGQKEKEIPYKLDKIDGTLTIWRENSLRISEVPYKAGKEDGEARYFGENGDETVKVWKAGVEVKE